VRGACGDVYFACEALVIPLYHKIRITFEAALKAVIVWEDQYFQNIACLDWTKSRPEWDVYLSTGSDFKSDLRARPAMDEAERRTWLGRCLPRFIWRAIAYSGTTPRFELVFDATDIEQADFQIGGVFYGLIK